MMAPMEDQTVTGQGWAVPGSAEHQPAPGDASGPGAPPGPGGPGALARTAAGPGADGSGSIPRVALRPMTVADILDGGFGVVKARPRRILAIAAGFAIPVNILVGFLQRGVYGGQGIADYLNDPAVANSSANDAGPAIGAMLAIVLSAVTLGLVTGAVAHLVGQWTMGRDAPAGEMLAAVGRKWFSILVAVAVVKVIQVFGLFVCYIGLLFLFPLFVPVTPIIVMESTGPFAAISRASQLERRRYWNVMGTALLIGAADLLLPLALSLLPQLVALTIGFRIGWPLAALGRIAAETVVVPFTAAATVLLYLDLRVRTEGLDIEMSAVRTLDRAT